MSFNQNNETRAWEDGRRRRDCRVLQHSQPQTLHARCCKRKFKRNSGRPNDYRPNELIEYQFTASEVTTEGGIEMRLLLLLLINYYLQLNIFIENCALITENENL